MTVNITLLRTLCTAFLIVAFTLSAPVQSQNKLRYIDVACSTGATDNTGRKNCQQQAVVRADAGYILDTSSLTGTATKDPLPGTSTADSWCDTRWRGHVVVEDGSRQPTKLVVFAKAKSPKELGQNAQIRCRLNVRMKPFQINSFVLTPVVE